MFYLPIGCEECASVSLLESTACEGSRATCPYCLGAALVLPGSAYPEGDITLFGEISRFLDEAALTPPVAGQLLLALEEHLVLDARSDAVLLGKAVHAIPKLRGAAELLIAHPQRLRQALSMLATLLMHTALSRRSGIVTASKWARTERRAG
jgi:hypothetical protein